MQNRWLVVSVFAGLMAAIPSWGHTSTITISCPDHASAGASVTCPMSLSLANGVTADSLTFGVAVIPNSSAPALTSGQVTFTEAVSGAFKNTAGTHNAISVLWSGVSPTLSGARSLGSLSFNLPVGATGA